MDTISSNSEKQKECSLSVANPVGILIFKPILSANRLKELKNKKIGLFWNRKARGDVALNRVKELLSEQFDGMGFEWFEFPPDSVVPKEWSDNLQKRGIDGAVASTGD